MFSMPLIVFLTRVVTKNFSNVSYYTILVSYTHSMRFYCHCKHYITLTSLHNIHEIKNLETTETRQQIWTALPNNVRCMVASIYWHRITIFHSSAPSFISLSQFPQLSTSSPLSYFHLPCYLHLPRDLSLPSNRSET
jgi:hypothetical protein